MKFRLLEVNVRKTPLTGAKLASIRNSVTAYQFHLKGWLMDRVDLTGNSEQSTISS
jgi:hypothetical protein